MNNAVLSGQSVAMKKVLRMVERLSSTNSRVLITGENGTGKELLARMLHSSSKRAHEAFVAVNCAAIPFELIESELFGYEKGAFTGAVKQHKGKFEQADGGTLFLDEVGDMSLGAQSKVLRALQEGVIHRVGGDSDIRVDVRVICATNKDLGACIIEGSFREDLYHRLSVIEIEVPALRDRRDDIPELVDKFLREICYEIDMGVPVISREAVELLSGLPLRGNVRELRNKVERLIVLGGTPGLITGDDVRELCMRSKH